MNVVGGADGNEKRRRKINPPTKFLCFTQPVRTKFTYNLGLFSGFSENRDCSMFGWPLVAYFCCSFNENLKW